MVHSSQRRSACATGRTQTLHSEDLLCQEDPSPAAVISDKPAEATSATIHEAGDCIRFSDADASEGSAKTEEATDIQEAGLFETTGEASPTTAATPRMARDSLVTVRLSEPPPLMLDAMTAPPNMRVTKSASCVIEEQAIDKSSHDIQSHASVPSEMKSHPRTTTSSIPHSRSLPDELGQSETDAAEADLSEDNEEVDWEQLEKTEDEQPKSEEADNVRSFPGLFTLRS